MKFLRWSDLGKRWDIALVVASVTYALLSLTEYWPIGFSILAVVLVLTVRARFRNRSQRTGTG